MKKEIKKLTKIEKEHIENKLLTTFAIALGAIMVLLYLMNWFQGSRGFMIAAEVSVYVFLAGFIALSVFCKLKANKFKKENNEVKTKKFNNWFIFSIVGAVASFLTYPSRILKLVQLGFIEEKLMSALSNFGLFLLPTRLLVLIALIALYTIVMFIYWGIYMHRAHKASLNKGKNK